MFRKLLIAIVLLNVLSMQIVNSLNCYTCYTPADCKKAKEVTCNIATANRTSEALSIYHQNVPYTNGSQEFVCVRNLWMSSNNKLLTTQVEGCLHANVSICSLYLKPQYDRYSWRRKCYTCKESYCNGSHPFNRGAFTLTGMILAFIISKILM